MIEYEYRVMYERQVYAGTNNDSVTQPHVWSRAQDLHTAQMRAQQARDENRWGEVWIERKPIVEWERVP